MRGLFFLVCLIFQMNSSCESKSIPPSSEATMREQVDVSEPSGLFWSARDEKLFVVSDNTGNVYELNGDFEIENKIKTNVSDAEGICIVEGKIVIANEALNTIEWHDMEGEPIFRLAPAYPESISSKNGIEGICYVKERKGFYFLIERKPRLIGFLNWPSMEINFNKVDFAEDLSGIGWDPKRNAFWIVSDQSKKAFLYSESKGVLHTILLPEKGAEGVAYDAKKDRLFICYDDSEILEVYDLSKID